MKKRFVFLIIMCLCITGLSLQALYLKNCTSSIYCAGSFSQEQRAQFGALLNADSLVTSFGSYTRSGWAFLQDGHERRYAEASLVSVWGNYVPAYTVRMISGRFLSPGDSRKAVLSAAQASTLFCTYDCVGRTVRIDGTPFEVIGVYAASGAAALLSRLGPDECFVSAAQPQDQWVITIAAGKETQREYTLNQSLSRLGVRGAVMVPLFRTRCLAFFLMRLEASALLALIVYSVLRRLNPALAQRRPRLTYWFFTSVWLMVAALFSRILSSFPLNPSDLPIAFTAEAIQQKLAELLIRWNNRSIVITMEGSYLNWLLAIVCALSIGFWISLFFFLQKRRNHCA